MRRFIAIILMLTMIMMSGSGCVKGNDTAENAFSDEIVESEREEQGSTDRPSSAEKDEETAEDDQDVVKKPEQDEPEKGDEFEDDPIKEEPKEEEPENQQEEPSEEEEATPSDEEQKEPSEEQEEEPSKDEQKEPTQEEEKQPTQNEETETPKEEEIPEDEENFPEDEEEIPEDEEEFPEEDEETPDEERDEEDSSDEGSTTITKPQAKPDPTPERIKVASYNIKALMHGKDTEGIIQELREIDADIVGLQEVDKNTTRSGVNVHQVELLAKSLGYPYWSFDKLIDYKGGEYGMAILSRYPIVSSDVVLYDDQEPKDSHVRKYGRHVLKVGSKNLAFYNTHLCIGDDNDSISTLQLKQVTDRMKKDIYAILTGDLNMQAPTAAKTLVNNKLLTLLNDGVGMIGKKDASKYIDNIIVSNMMDYETNDSGMAIEVSETEYSDHNLIYTYVSFK